MAILEILKYPDPRLRTVAKPVSTVDDEMRTLIEKGNISKELGDDNRHTQA